MGVVAVACVHVFSQEPPKPLLGRWTCSGDNALGDPYEARLDIVALGDVYELTWRNTQGQPVLRGLGLLMNDQLSVALVFPHLRQVHGEGQV